MVPESSIEPVDIPALADAELPSPVPTDGLGPHGRGEAERRPGHVDGPGPGQVAARGARGPELPRRHRPPGALGPRGVRRPAAAGVHGQLPHVGRHHAGAGRLRPLRRRSAAGLPAEQGAQAPRRRPDPGDVGGGPGPRVVPARPRRPLHRPARQRPARPADRRPASPRRSSPTPTTSVRPPTRRSPSGSPAPAPRSPSRRSVVPPRTARAATSPGVRRTAGSCCARPRRRSTRTRTRSPTCPATGSAPPTTCGSTWWRCATSSTGATGCSAWR